MVCATVQSVPTNCVELPHSLPLWATSWCCYSMNVYDRNICRLKNVGTKQVLFFLPLKTETKHCWSKKIDWCFIGRCQILTKNCQFGPQKVPNMPSAFTFAFVGYNDSTNNLLPQFHGVHGKWSNRLPVCKVNYNREDAYGWLADIGLVSSENKQAIVLLDWNQEPNGPVQLPILMLSSCQLSFVMLSAFPLTPATIKSKSSGSASKNYVWGHFISSTFTYSSYYLLKKK